MTKIKYGRHLFLSTGIALVLGISGCAGSIQDEQKSGINVTSEPAGATVYASDTKIGTTPMLLPAGTFPKRFVGVIFRTVGTLSLKKSGCETYTIEVDDKILAKDIYVSLECGPEHIEVSPPISETEKETDVLTGTSRSIELRLKELDTLREKGLITAEEYRTIRKRILNEL